MPWRALPTAFTCCRPRGTGDIAPLAWQKDFCLQRTEVLVREQRRHLSTGAPVWCSVQFFPVHSALYILHSMGRDTGNCFSPINTLEAKFSVLSLAPDSLSHQSRDLTESSLRWMEIQILTSSTFGSDTIHAVSCPASPDHHVQVSRMRADSQVS